MLRDRHERARELGLPSEEIESIFRLLMRSSRDHQAALRAEVPMDAASYTVAIIGGHGRIGRVMARLFGDLGHRLLLVDTDTDLRAEMAQAAWTAGEALPGWPAQGTAFAAALAKLSK